MLKLEINGILELKRNPQKKIKRQHPKEAKYHFLGVKDYANSIKIDL